jgi:hypothetical protein
MITEKEMCKLLGEDKAKELDENVDQYETKFKEKDEYFPTEEDMDA